MELTRNCATAVVTAYNAERHLRRCVESILGQTHAEVRIIVVDDCSTDRTAQVALSYGSNVRLIKLPNNRGPAAGRTMGLMAVASEYVAFLDADDQWLPEFVETTVRYLSENPKTVAVSTGYRADAWSGQRFYRPDLDGDDERYYGLEGAVCPNFYLFWSKYRSILTGSVMMRTDVAQRTGGQREDLRLTEDLEFWGYLATFGDWAFIPKHLFATDQRVFASRERLTKLKKRCAYSRHLTVESWSRRIAPRLCTTDSMRGFDRLLAHIATTIALANAYTFEFHRSYRLARLWRDRLDTGLGGVLRWGLLGGPVFWPLVCLLLRARETAKSFLAPIKMRLR
jgi:hypothetical protein